MRPKPTSGRDDRVLILNIAGISEVRLLGVTSMENPIVL
jgi:hypothetical protein